MISTASDSHQDSADHERLSVRARRPQLDRMTVTYCTLFCALALSGWIALSVGAVSFSVTELASALSQGLSSLWHNANYSNIQTGKQNVLILWEIRLPRVMLSLLIGGILATCGVLTQGLFRNPLADPALIGVTAGASAGASLVIALGLTLGISAPSALAQAPWLLESLSNLLLFFGLNSIALGAFMGALAAMGLIYLLAHRNEHSAIGTLLMTGLALTAFVGGFTQLLSNLVDDATLRQLSLWHMGGLQGATLAQCSLAGTAALILFLIARRCALSLDALALGEQEAVCLGVALPKLKRVLIISIAAGIGICVTLAGTIAFVGLIVPHILRQVVGPSHRLLLPTSVLAGGLLLLIADTIARTLLSPTELPVGALTTLLGAPFFIGLLLKQRARLLTLA